MAKHTNRATPEINASSMADIAFLLLIFFLVTTTIGADKGLQMLLPPEKTIITPPSNIHDRNLFKVIINSRNELLVEGMPMNITALRKETKKFLANNGADPALSDDPQTAVVSLKTDRGTSYNTYVTVLDELMAAYNELRAEKLGITVERYLELDEKNPKENKMLKYAQKVYPRRLSEAESTSIQK